MKCGSMLHSLRFKLQYYDVNTLIKCWNFGKRYLIIFVEQMYDSHLEKSVVNSAGWKPNARGVCSPLDFALKEGLQHEAGIWLRSGYLLLPRTFSILEGTYCM